MANLISIILVSVAAGIVVHYLSHRIPWALEREWLAESLDYLELEQQGVNHSGKLAYPEKLPGVLTLWPFCKKEQVLDGPYTPWWLSGLFLFLLVIFFYQFGSTLAFGCAALFVVITVLASRIDYCHQVLPDKLTYSLIWTGLVVNTLALFAPLSSAVWAVVFSYVLIGGLSFLLSKLLNRMMLGAGDVKLLAGIGAWVGLKGIIPVILIASVVFIVIAILGGWLSDQWNRVSAFGPYLTLGGLITLWLGPVSLFAQLQSWLSI